LTLVYDRKMDFTPKRTEHNLIVRISKSNAEANDNKTLRSIVILKLTTDRPEASRGLSATLELLVHCTPSVTNERCVLGTCTRNAIILTMMTMLVSNSRYCKLPVPVLLSSTVSGPPSALRTSTVSAVS